jgi:hypothetical protein
VIQPQFLLNSITLKHVLTRYDQFTPVCVVHTGEALGLLSALTWVHELNLGPVDFELDSKM